MGIELGSAPLDPIGRKTALTLAVLFEIAQGVGHVLVKTTADQTAGNPAVFTTAVQSAVQEAATGTTVTLGVTPTHPKNGYGFT